MNRNLEGWGGLGRGGMGRVGGWEGRKLGGWEGERSGGREGGRAGGREGSGDLPITNQPTSHPARQTAKQPACLPTSTTFYFRAFQRTT